MADDVPPSSAARQQVKYKANTDVYHFVFVSPDGAKYPFQCTVAACNGSKEEAARICRLCYAKFEEGLAKSEVMDFRNKLIGTLSGQPAVCAEQSEKDAAKTSIEPPGAAAKKAAPAEAAAKTAAAEAKAKRRMPVCKRPARASSRPATGDDEKKPRKPVCKRPARTSSRPAVTARPALGQAGTPAAVSEQRGRWQSSKGPRRVDRLVAKYSWGRADGPPPASVAELQSLAKQMTRLRKEAGNFGRPERADPERLARAKVMLQIMRGKARAGFGGGRAMATHGLTLNRSAGSALTKRARKLWNDLEAHSDPLSPPSELIKEGIALFDAD